MHSWELVTAVDGPGTRMTTFLAGCPLRCLYCHNPDTMAASRGVPVRAEDLLARIRRYRGVFRATGGGITLSGGEVLQQPAFAARILRGAKEMGIHTALDTSGFLGRNATDELLADVDLVLLDVKAGDEATYHRVTGRRLQPTLDFGRRLGARHRDVDPVRPRPRPDRRPRHHRADRRVCCLTPRGRACRGAPVPPDGARQVGGARTGVRLPDTQAPSQEGRGGAGAIPGPGAARLLSVRRWDPPSIWRAGQTVPEWSGCSARGWRPVTPCPSEVEQTPKREMWPSRPEGFVSPCG